MRTPIDNFHGRRVTDIVSHGGDASDWGIQLEGDVIFWNTDARRTSAPDKTAMLGLSFISSSADDLTTDLDFGTVDSETYEIHDVVGISLTTRKYRVVGPGISNEDSQDETGQATEIELPPDPSPDRVVDGPSEEWIEPQPDEEAHAAWMKAQEEAAGASVSPGGPTDDAE